MAGIVRPRGGAYYWATSYRFPPEYTEYIMHYPLRPGRDTVVGRVLLAGTIAHLPDVLADPEYRFFEGQKLGGFRTALGVPLLRDGTPIGVIILTRPTVRPFSGKEIELATPFGDQAGSADRNVGLFEAEQQRTRELSEALEQQSATSEVLGVISSSPGELAPVFEVMLANAVRICGAKFGVLWLKEGDGYRSVAVHDLPPALAELR